jgi:hypothetical protein
VRVGEFEPGGILHVFRQVNGKQRSRSLKVRRVDLDGDTPKKKIAAAETLGHDFIKELAGGRRRSPRPSGPRWSSAARSRSKGRAVVPVRPMTPGGERRLVGAPIVDPATT